MAYIITALALLALAALAWAVHVWVDYARAQGERAGYAQGFSDGMRAESARGRDGS